MQNKSFITAIGVIVILVLVTGACAAGFVAGMGVRGGGGMPLANLPFLEPGGSALPQGPAAGESAPPKTFSNFLSPSGSRGNW